LKAALFARINQFVFAPFGRKQQVAVVRGQFLPFGEQPDDAVAVFGCELRHED